jgi:mannose-6-phosphate isomerase-like protein (cupin superfamily)
MAKLISTPTVTPASGQPPKIIEEFIGRVNSSTTAVSIARITSPSGWREPGQKPEFDEYTIVLRGELQVETREALYKVAVGQTIIVPAGEWVRYSTPGAEGAEYVAVCLPAFSPETVHRDATSFLQETRDDEDTNHGQDQRQLKRGAEH